MHDIRLHAFIGDCRDRKNKTFLTYIWLLAFAAKLCTSFGVKLVRWLPDWPLTTTGFCCETLHQFWCETFTVIAWLTTYDYWLLLRNFAPVLVWNFYGDCLTDYLRLLAFAAKLCASSNVKLLRWLPDWLPTLTGFCCETFVVIVLRHTIMASWLQKKWVSKIKLRMTSSNCCRESYYKNTLSVWLLKVNCCHSIFENMDSIVFIPQQRGPCLLSGVYVNDKTGNHPPHVETRVKDRERYVTLWARGFQKFPTESLFTRNFLSVLVWTFCGVTVARHTMLAISMCLHWIWGDFAEETTRRSSLLVMLFILKLYFASVDNRWKICIGLKALRWSLF